MIKHIVMVVTCLTISSFVYAAEKVPTTLYLRPYYLPATDRTVIAELLTIADKEKRVEYAQQKAQEEIDALEKSDNPVSNRKQAFNDICKKWGLLSQLVNPLPATP